MSFKVNDKEITDIVSNFLTRPLDNPFVTKFSFLVFPTDGSTTFSLKTKPLNCWEILKEENEEKMHFNIRATKRWIDYLKKVEFCSGSWFILN